MGHDHRSPAARHITLRDLHYLKWYIPNQSWFFQPPPCVYMAANTSFEITVQSDGPRKQPISITQAVRDSELDKSLIAEHYARASKGQIEKCSPIGPLQDSTGQTYTSNEYVTLRWWESGTPKTYSETFYVVKGCGRFDVILKANCGKSARASQLLPLQNRPLNEEQMREQERRRQLAAAEQAAARRAHDQQVREQYQSQQNQGKK